MSEMSDLPVLALGARVERVVEQGVEAWALPLDVPEVVSFRASFPTGIDLSSPQRMVQRVAARLLDRGSEKRDRFEVAGWLEGRGAELHFFSDATRMGFAGRALRDDVADVLALAAELLAVPRFDPADIERVVREIEASLRQAASDTGYRSSAALSQALYTPDHPGYSVPLESQRAQLAALTRDDLLRFHEASVSARSLTVALAGDLSGVDVQRLIAPLAGTPGSPQEMGFSPVRSPRAQRTDVPVPDKANLDVRLGHGLRLRRRDDAYLPLRAGVFALGGNFSARLMQEVRDRRGLTYGIRAALDEVDVDHDGHLDVSATFSPADLQRGLEATMDVVERWHAEGVSEDERDRVVDTLSGAYDVGLSTTRGLASLLLSRAEQGFEPGYLDAYRDEIRRVSRDEINEAIARHVRPEALLTVVSGPVAAEEG